MELSRKALEILRDCDQNKMACADCPPHKPPEQICYRFLWTRGEIAALALALMDERDRLRMQVRAAEDVIEKASAVISAETDEGLAALCALQAWAITPTEMYYRNEAEMEAAHAEAGQ